MEHIAPVVSDTKADQGYLRMRAAVQEGQLRPGEKITERDLAARLDVSPTPVREALRQLIHERVVERAGPRALRIADHDAGSIAEIAEMSAHLSGLCARFAARKRTPALLDALAQDLAEADAVVLGTPAPEGGDITADDVARVLAVLRRFHGRIEAAVGNPVMEALLGQSRVFTPEERTQRTVERIRGSVDSFARRYAEHHEILTAISAGDEALAQSLAERHALSSLHTLSS